MANELSENDCYCHDNCNPHIDSYTISWLNPDTNTVENIIAIEENPNKKPIVIPRGIRNLDTITGCNRARAERAAKWMLRQHNLEADEAT